MADWRPSTQHWGIVTKTLHWLMAIMIIGLLAAGFIMEGLENSNPLKFQIYQIHKSFGLTIMVLAALRLIWRFTGETPPLPAGTPAWQVASAHASHVSLYGLMVLMPLSGYVMTSASTLGIPTKYFGLFTVPHLIERNADLSSTASEVHEIVAFAFIAVLSIHILAAIKHVLIDGDGVFARMLPGRP